MTQLRSQYPLLVAAAAGLCWAAALALLIFGDLQRLASPLAPERLLYYALVLASALLTFVPIEARLSLTGLTIEGVIGFGVLAYTLAFVPAPQGWLLDPADLPIYGLFFIALLIAGAAAARPFIAVLSRRFYQQRARAFDQRRVRRQAYEVGLFLAASAALASLQALSWVSMLLLFVAILIAELLLLARVPAAP
jgi:hypothetical protein